MKPTDRDPGKPALEICEEAIYLLRRSPVIAWISYLIGAAPFILALLFFWVDMTRGAFAEEHALLSSLWLALLFIWMKTWQSIFALQLRAARTGESFSWSFAGFLRLAFSQFRLQMWGLFLLPIAMILTLPFGWTYAYYQNLTVLGSFSKDNPQALGKQALSLSALWPRQNHLLLMILSGFGFFVFLNIGILLASLPKLLIMLFGLKEIFNPGAWAFLNATFLAIVLCLTYLLVDPIIKTVYLLRCFYGQSRQSGEDLRVELKRAQSLRVQSAISLLFLFLTAFSAFGQNPNTPTPSPSSQITAQALDQKISEVLNGREFAWRFPRQQKQGEVNWLSLFAEELGKWIEKALQKIGEWLVQIVRWVANFWKPKSPSTSGGLFSLIFPQFLLWVLLGCVVAILAILLLRYRANRHRPIAQAQTVALVPDLADENVRADQLPEDEWLKMARELMDSGNLRMAIRALFLGSLAALAQKERITLARFKSNRDYDRELRRRAAGLPQLHSAFAENISIYDRIWYGLHEPTADLYQLFQGNLEAIRAC